MLFIRLYLAALTLMLMILLLANRGIGMLEAMVITCPILYLILDVRADLQELKKLEKGVSLLSR